MAAVLGKLDGLGSSIGSKAQNLLDGFFPPERRAVWYEKIKGFVLKNPKISAFLLTNLALSGGPLFLFILFSITVFIFALIVALIVALLITVAFTLTCVGVALMFLFPIIFFTTLTAVFIFLSGLGFYYIWKKFNDFDKPGDKGQTIGDTINAMTGNRLDFVMDNAREGHVERQMGHMQEEWKEPSPHHAPKPKAGQKRQNDHKDATPKKNETTNGTPKKKKKPAQQHQANDDDDEGTTSGTDTKERADSPMNGVKSGAESVKKTANPDQVTGAAEKVTNTAGLGDASEKVKGVPRKLGNAPGSVKNTASGASTAAGMVGGASGLT